MPFVTPKATYHIDGPDKKIIELSEGWKFPFRSMDTDVSCNRILWKGEYDQADGCFTCSRPLYRINCDLLNTTEKWDWFYKLFLFQLNSNLERSLFFDEDPSDVFQTNKFLDEKWQVPIHILQDLAKRNLITNANTKRFLADRVKQESLEPKADVVVEQEVVTAPAVASSRTTAKDLLKKQDTLGEFNK